MNVVSRPLVGRASSQASLTNWSSAVGSRGRSPHQHHSQSAFSLIEVMVAILILGIALVGLTQGITTALGSSKESELQTAAMLYAQGKIEELRATAIIEGEDDGDCGTGLELYHWKQNVTTTELDGLYDVEVTVENARTGQEICALRTLLFEVPVSDEAAKDKEQDAKSKKKGGGK